MKYLDKSMPRSISLACAILGIAATLSGCGSRTDSSGVTGTTAQSAQSAAQTAAHVPPTAAGGQAALNQHQAAAAQGYAAYMKQMAKQHKQ